MRFRNEARVYFKFVALFTLMAMLFTALPLSANAQGRVVRDSSRGVGDGSKSTTVESKVADDESEFETETVVCSAGHIDFTNAGGSSSTSNGNVRMYSGGGVSVKATAWERTKGAGGTWQTAYLGQYGSAGLGVTDRVEGGGDPQHKVDNNGERLNYVAFAFDQPISLDEINLQSVSTDSDLTVYIGTVANAYTTLPTLSDSLLTGFYSESNLGGNSNRDANVNAGNVVGNVVVVAAKVDESNDYFKIEDIRKNCPGTQITFVKQVFTVDQTHGSTQSFGFTSTGLGSSAFSLVDNNVVGPDRITFSIPQDTDVTVTEGTTIGFTLVDVSCVGTQNWSWNPTGTTVSVKPAPGENVTCTFTNGQLGASAAKVSVSGRALLRSSRGVSGAVLTLWDIETGETRQVMTNSFGHYQFDEVEVGKFYVMSISHPRYVFSQNTQTFSLEDTLTSLDFVY